MPTIRDVANAAGVSTATVSYVINETKNVSPETKKRVKDAIIELDYHVNAIAKSLKKHETHRIAVVTTDASGQFFPYVIKGITTEAESRGYNITLYNSAANIKKEMQCLNDIISNQYDGVLLDSVINTQQIPQYAKTLQKMFRGGSNGDTPLVVMERDFSAYGIDSVCFNIYQGALYAIDHLVDMGCRHIAFISPPPNFDERIRAFHDSMKLHKLTVDPRMIEVGNFSHAAGYSCMKKILSHGLEIDGVFTGNDEMAVGVYQALGEAKLKIPYQIKVIGFDDIFLCSVIHPTLSSIHLEKEAMGTAAMLTLYRRETGLLSKEAVRIELPCRLIVRHSTDPNVVISRDWVVSSW